MFYHLLTGKAVLISPNGGLTSGTLHVPQTMEVSPEKSSSLPIRWFPFATDPWAFWRFMSPTESLLLLLHPPGGSCENRRSSPERRSPYGMQVQGVKADNGAGVGRRGVTGELQLSQPP